MKKPIIGVIPLYDEEKNSYWMIPGYLNGIQEAGGIPMILPVLDNPTDLNQVLSTLDGVLFPGGQDVDPSIYNHEKKSYCGQIYQQRDTLEAYILNYVIEHQIPALGICRGIQFMNAALGGTLYQDLDIEHPSTTNHHMTPPYDRGVHMVRIIKDTPLYEILHKDELSVNSYHHKAIWDLSTRLKAMAISEDDLIEAVYMPNHKFLIALQWHPELSKDSVESKQLFKSFVDASLIK